MKEPGTQPPSVRQDHEETPLWCIAVLTFGIVNFVLGGLAMYLLTGLPFSLLRVLSR